MTPPGSRRSCGRWPTRHGLVNKLRPDPATGGTVDATLDLVLLEPRHAPMLYSLVDDNRAHLRRYLPWVDGTRSVQDSMQYITASLEQFARSQSLQVGIFSGNTLAGMCGYHLIDWNNRRTGIGYWLAQPFRGQGIMTAVVQRFTQWMFEQRPSLVRIEANVFPTNPASIRILEKAGFLQEGYHRKVHLKAGKYLDGVMMAVIRSPES